MDPISTQGYRQISDDGFIIARNSSSWGESKQDLSIVKTDASGSMEGNKTYGGENDDYGLGKDTVDSGYLFVVIKDAWKTTEVVTLFL